MSLSASLKSTSTASSSSRGRSHNPTCFSQPARFLNAPTQHHTRCTLARSGPPSGQMKSSEEIRDEVIQRVRLTTAEECPFCRDAPVKENGSKCVGVCRNPQNVPGPLLYPHDMQTAEDAVRLQLNAMKQVHDPRYNHGLQVLYEFAVEAGMMERSRYFGYESDLYHFDHFMGKSMNAFGEMVDCKSYEIKPAELMPCKRTRVEVVVENSVGVKFDFTFIMVLRTFGKYKGCWNTHRLLPSDSPYMSKI
eukprot:gene27619-7256_t